MKTMEFEKKLCPDCNGSGVYQEYHDEYDRYTVHSCATCDGSGEIARQSVTSEEVQEAIDQIESLIKAIGNDPHWRSDKLMKSLNFAITALQAYQLKPTSKVQEAVKQKLTTDAIEYLNKKMKQPFVEKEGVRTCTKRIH